MSDITDNKCDARVILNLMNTQRTWTEKHKFLQEQIDNCASGSKKTKTKRKMSGWNCYLKHCANQNDMDFPKCMQDKKRKEKEYIPNKEFYDFEANNGCVLK